MAPPLFREEAKQSLRVRLEGEVVALSPPSLKRLTLALGIGLGVAVFFGSFATYTKYTPASGILAPKEGLVTVAAPITGDVIRITVEQGQKVAAGQSLAAMKNTQAQAEGPSSYEKDKALLASRKTIADNSQRAKVAEQELAITAALTKVQGLTRTLAAARDTLRTSEQAAKASASYLEQQRTLVSKGYLASAALATPEHAYLLDMQAVKQAQQALISLEADLSTAEQAVVQSRGQLATLLAQKDDSTTSLAMEESKLAASAEAAVTSSLAGTVAAIPALRGPAAAGTPLFVIAPPGRTYARLYLSEFAMQKAKVGQAVVMQVVSQAPMEAQKLHGRIESLASAPVALLAQSSGEKPDQGYLALVALDEALPPAYAPLGARVEARLQVQTKSLLGWLFDPVTRGLQQTSLKN